ncbi:MAG: T9SS type A sorting domain-containing protein [Reichenbachiella sp.]|uniref:T9SS type A sorting domain-containing protein n=1 Tax=Reichenbachiella sp. TaxID=2184521 RepID=UPI00329851B9
MSSNKIYRLIFLLCLGILGYETKSQQSLNHDHYDEDVELNSTFQLQYKKITSSSKIVLSDGFNVKSQASGIVIFGYSVSESQARENADILGIEDNSVIIYPNPFTDNILNIKVNGNYSNSSIRVVDLNGKIIYASILNITDNHSIQIELDHRLIDGVFVLELLQDGKVVSRSQILKMAEY